MTVKNIYFLFSYVKAVNTNSLKACGYTYSIFKFSAKFYFGFHNMNRINESHFDKFLEVENFKSPCENNFAIQ